MTTMNNKRHVPLVEGAGLSHLGPSGCRLPPQSLAHAKRFATLIIIPADLRITRYVGLKSDMIENAVLRAHEVLSGVNNDPEPTVVVAHATPRESCVLGISRRNHRFRGQARLPHRS